MAIVKILSFARDEELVANGLKIVRQCVQDEANLKRTILDYPDMINEIIQDTYINFDSSSFINGEMKQILTIFTKKKDYVYLIKPDSIAILARHPGEVVKNFPVLDQISQLQYGLIW